jgi:hypothetical protein
MDRICRIYLCLNCCFMNMICFVDVYQQCEEECCAIARSINEGGALPLFPTRYS